MLSGKGKGKEEGPEGVEALLKSLRIAEKKKCMVFGVVTAQGQSEGFKHPSGNGDKRDRGLIGQAMGEFLEAEVDAEGMAVGEFLRIKVKLDVQEPLMRGIKIQVCPGDREGEEEEEGEDSEEESDEDQGDERMEGLKRKKKKRKWCSFAYEYLRISGTHRIIGHMDKSALIS
ncbi:hypothetical protein ZWY2020_051598 [Hordeum vulgare]|nr:hypothetical protein ZWY2020_051598 [Hordeum vulgare]